MNRKEKKRKEMPRKETPCLPIASRVSLSILSCQPSTFQPKKERKKERKKEKKTR
jgi:hypothetical protein